MEQFVIRELQNANSYRAGECITARDLSAAKRIATRRQVFQGTVLEISSGTDTSATPDHNTVLSVKESGRWIDAA